MNQRLSDLPFWILHGIVCAAPSFLIAVSTGFTSLGSISGMILVQLIEKFGMNSEKIKNQLYKQDFVGALGTIRFDRFGDVVNLEYTMKRIDAGGPVTIR